MAKYVSVAFSLVGGNQGSLDAVNGSTLNQGDAAIVLTDAGAYFYTLNATSDETPDSLNIIIPLNNPGTKRWILSTSLLKSGDLSYVDIASDQTITGDKTFSGISKIGDNKYVNSYTQDFERSFTPAPYLTSGEYVELCTITPTADSRNYEIIGEILVAAGSDVQLMKIFIGLRSDVLPNLSWNTTYTQQIIGGSEFVKPVLWTKETDSSAFKLAIFHRGTAGNVHHIWTRFSVVNRGDYNDIVVPTSIVEISTIPTDFSENFFTQIVSGTGGGGAVGATGNAVFYENDIHVTGNYTINSGKNAMTAGPVIIDDGVTVEVPDGSVWTVV